MCRFLIKKKEEKRRLRWWLNETFIMITDLAKIVGNELQTFTKMYARMLSNIQRAYKHHGDNCQFMQSPDLLYCPKAAKITTTTTIASNKLFISNVMSTRNIVTTLAFQSSS